MTAEAEAPTHEAPGSTSEPHDSRSVPDALAGSPWSRLDVVLAGAVFVGVFLIAWWWRTEIVSTDPWHYIRSALNFPSDDWVPLGYTRYGMILPAGLPVVLFGKAQVTYYALAMGGSAVLATCVYLLGARWWGRAYGLLAVGLLVSNYVVFVNLSRYYPDLFSMALVFTALVIAVVVRSRALDHRDGIGTVLLLLWCGFMLGWSFEARETSLFAWIPVIVVLWVRGRVLRHAFYVALPVLAWAVLDVAISAIAYGDPLLKLHTFTRQDLSQAQNPTDVAVLDQFVGRPRLEYLQMIPDRLLADGGPPGGTWMVVLGILSLLAILARQGAVRLMGLSFAFTYLMVVGIGGFFFPEHPAGRLDIQRYWIPFVPFMALAVAGAVAVLVAWLARRSPALGHVALITLAAVLLFPAVSATAQASNAPAFAPNGGAALSEVRDFLAAEADSGVEDVTVWSDWQTVRLLPIYGRGAWGGEKVWDFGVDSLTSGREPQAGDFVVIVSQERPPCIFCNSALAPWREENPSPPSTWTPVLTTSNDTMTVYRVE